MGSWSCLTPDTRVAVLIISCAFFSIAEKKKDGVIKSTMAVRCKSFRLLIVVGLAEGFQLRLGIRAPVSRKIYGPMASHSDGGAQTASRRELLLAGGVAAAGLLGQGKPAIAFENRKQGIELFPQLNGVPYGTNTPVPSGVGAGGELRGCPSTEGTARPAPNCFSSSAPRPASGDLGYFLEPFSFKGKGVQQAMDDLVAAAKAYPPGQSKIDAGGWKIVKSTDTYLYMQFESGKIGYIDDLEFLLDDASKSVAGRPHLPHRLSPARRFTLDACAVCGPLLIAACVAAGICVVRGHSVGQNSAVLLSLVSCVQASVRSASRTGFLDFAVNAKRINWFASALSDKGWATNVITPANHADYYLQNGNE